MQQIVIDSAINEWRDRLKIKSRALEKGGYFWTSNVIVIQTANDLDYYKRVN